MRYIWGLLVLTLSVFAQPREALLIGNYNYEHISVLDDTKPNIGRLEKVLKDLKFNVETEENLDSESLEESIDTFAKRLSRDRNTIGLLYYSGHGCQLNNRGYLLPIDVDSRKKRKIKYRALSIDEMLETLEASSNRLNMLFLDACRDVPTGTKGGTKGLVRLGSTPKGALVVYATESGKTADDNSNFIDALINNINKPNEQIVNVVADIADEVEQKTKEAQIPVFFYKSLPKKFVLNKVHAEQTSLQKPSLVKNTDSKALHKCRVLTSESFQVKNDFSHQKSLQACKRVDSTIGKGYVAVNLYLQEEKEASKELLTTISKELKSLCKQSNSDACYLFGYYQGFNSNVEGTKYYKKACDLDNPYACNAYASNLFNGTGITKNLPKAFEAYKKSCSLDYLPSCSSQGWFHEAGIGTPKDTKKALKLYKSACEQGNGLGCNNYGSLYARGQEVMKDLNIVNCQVSPRSTIAKAIS